MREMPSGHERTLRLLEGRLEILAAVSERSPASERRLAGHVEAVAAATRRAVALDLLSADEARAVWSEVARRHPAAGWCVAPSLAA